VDWVPQSGDFTEIVALLFDGGVLTPTDIARIVLLPTEVRSFRFVTLEEAERLLDPEQYARVTAVLNNRSTTNPTYLENGHVPTQPLTTPSPPSSR
jgi:hypothetical protein